MNNRKKVNPHEKLGSQEITQMQNDTLGEIYKNIEQLYKMRLIEKLARPIDKRTKQSFVLTFQQLLNTTHNKISKFRTNLIQKLAYQDAAKQKSLEQQLTNRNTNLKKKIRLIESKYNQVFVQGSFKHYPKVKETFNLQTQLQLIPILDWSNDCIQRLTGGTSTCC